MLLEPWVPPHIRGGLAELEAAAPEGLASKRTASLARSTFPRTDR